MHNPLQLYYVFILPALCALITLTLMIMVNIFYNSSKVVEFSFLGGGVIIFLLLLHFMFLKSDIHLSILSLILIYMSHRLYSKRDNLST